MSDLETYLNAHRERQLEELFELLRIPSISTDPAHRQDVERCAQHLCDHFEEMGFEAELVATAGHPILYAEWTKAAGAPTILLYGHYDVQPPDPVELWDSPPFEPTVRDGSIFARGACDDKGQVFAHVKGLEALLAVEGELPVNVKAIIEGEEESGSASLQPFLEAHRDRLDGDVVLISDTAMVAPRTPTICYALRGLAYLQINLTGPNRDLHSGTYGGAVDNPINALCHIVDRLKSRDGLVQIPGFYDDVRPLDEAERNEMAALDFDEEAFLDAVGCVPFGEPGFTTLERIGARPSLDVNGIWGGYTGAGAKTVLPSSAHAKVSMRLVPDQRSRDIADQFARFVESIAPDTVTVEVERMHGGEPSISDRESAYVAAAVRALEQVFGKEPVFIREGGSIPVVSSFKETLGLDAILAGFGLSSDRIHSPNEKFDLENYYAAIQFSSLVWSQFAKG